MSSREYAQTMTLTLQQLRDARDSSQVIYDNTFKKSSPNYEGIVAGLGGFTSTILATVFIASTPAAIASVAIATLSSLVQVGAKAALRDMYQTGMTEINEPIRFLERQPKYDMVEITLPFIEFTTNGSTIRFISGAGVVKKVHVVGGGWTIL